MTTVSVKEDNIVWSGKEFKLSDFVKIYPPPQIVKVEEGYLDETDEERTVSSSQLLTLHAIEDFTTVRATDTNSLQISLPTTSPAKVEIVCEPSHYENVEQLAHDLPQFVSLVESHHWLNLDENDVLEIKDKMKSFRNIHLRCLNLTKRRCVELPLAYAARFKVLGECPVLRPTMADIVKHCTFPCVVRFIDDKLKIVHDGYNANFPFGLNAIGPLTLHSIAQHKVILATTWEDDRRDRVIPLPFELEIRVVAALGAIQNDRDYSKLCKIVHNQAISEKRVLRFIRDGEFKVLLEEKDVPAPSTNLESHDYIDIGPKVPSRLLKPGSKESRACVRFERQLSVPDRPPRLVAGSLDDNIERTERTRSISVNLRGEHGWGDDANLDDVFGYSITRSNAENKESTKPRFSSMRNALKDIKHATKNEYKAFKKAVRPKFNSPHCDDSYDEVTPVSGNATSSHASSNSLEMNLNPEYREVNPLPANIAADRRNDGFLARLNISINKKEKFSKCKIQNPDDLRTWTIDEVSECLRYCHLEEYVKKFQLEKIDGFLLADLDEESLTFLGITNKLHIIKIMKIIGGWLPKM